MLHQLAKMNFFAFFQILQEYFLSFFFVFFVFANVNLALDSGHYFESSSFTCLQMPDKG